MLAEGADRAINGEPGQPQDAAVASDAPAFTDAEHVLDFGEPAATIQRRCAALNITAPRARARIAGVEVTVRAVQIVPAERRAEPGTVLAENPDGWTIQTADAPVRLLTR